MIKEAIANLLEKNNLDCVSMKEAFDEIVTGLADIELISSFISVLSAKEETEDEILCAVLASRDSVKKLNFAHNTQNLIENISLCDYSNIFDVMLINDLICCACGLGVARYRFDSPFENNYSFEVLKSAGFNFKPADYDYSQDFELHDFAYVTLSNDSNYYKYTSEIERKLPFKTIFSITKKLLNPYGAKNQYIGTNNISDVEKYANISLGLNNSNTIVLSSEANLPFVAPEGKTYVAEAWKNKIFSYNLTPDLMGLNEYSIDDIKVENIEHSAGIILDILNNRSSEACFNTAVINAALSLYISKIAPSLTDGLELAKKTLKDGAAKEKFEQLKNIYS